jgi:aspartate racemase
MKTIGLIGGMSWESSSLYYQIINREIQARLGGVHSAHCLMYSVDFGEIAALQHAGDWEACGQRLADAARSLERGGADLIVLCTNTMHKLTSYIEEAGQIPLLHIVDATAADITRHQLDKVGLLATRFTMEGDFLRSRYKQLGIQTIIPESDDRTIIHDIIYHELVKGIVKPESRAKYQEIISKLISQGAQGIIAGCTEIEILITPEDITVPLFQTTRLHAIAAVDYALQ